MLTSSCMLLLAALALPAHAVVVSTGGPALPGLRPAAPPAAESRPSPSRAGAAWAAAWGRQALMFLKTNAANPDPEIRAAVAAAWGEIGNPAVAPMLKKAARDRDDFVRIEAATSLYRLGQESGRETLMDVVRGSATAKADLTPAQEMKLLARTKARAMALSRLSDMGSEEVVALMETTLRDPSGAVRDATAVALCRLGLEEEFPRQFLEAANDRDDSVRAAAVKALGETGLGSVRQAILTAAADPSAAVRAEAVAALAAAAEETLAPVLIERLKDENPRIRYLAAGGLARLAQDSAVVPVLRRLAADEKTPDLALRAMAGLAARGEAVDLDLAQRSLGAKDIDGRMLALEVIAAAPGEPALRLLTRVIESDPALRVRVAAAAMLVKRLQRKAAP